MTLPINNHVSNPFLQSKTAQQRFGLRSSSKQPVPSQAPQIPGGIPDDYKYHVIIPVPERPPFSKGGLGVVGVDLPENLNKAGIADARVIQPYLKPMAEQNKTFTPEKQHHDTGVSVTIKDMYGRDEKFTLMERFEEKTNTWVYSVANLDWFENINNFYSDEEYGGYQQNWWANMLFAKAAAEFVPYISGEKEAPGQHLHTFSKEEHGGKADVILANDWQTAMVLSLAKSDNPHLLRLFMLHNTYDKQYEFKNEFPEGLTDGVGVKATDTDTEFSPLATGFRAADATILNFNYGNTVLNTDFLMPDGNYLGQKLPNGLNDRHHAVLNALNVHYDRGTAFDMHHPVPNFARPDDIEKLQPNTNVNPFNTGVNTLDGIQALQKLKVSLV